MVTEDVVDEEETKAGTLDLDGIATGNAVEAVEDTFVLVRRKTEAGVGDTKSGPGVVSDGECATDVDSAGGVFDGVIENVEDGRPEVFCDALDVEADGPRDGLENDSFGG